MQVRDDVKVFTTFTNGWTPGFHVAQVVADCYRLRRTSDGSVLPTDRRRRRREMREDPPVEADNPFQVGPASSGLAGRTVTSISAAPPSPAHRITGMGNR
jgi:hypothetical protein